MVSRIFRAAVLGVAVIGGVIVTAQSPAVTFHKDVEAILQKNCQTCHRPGQVAPMSFMTYEAARPYARAMKAAVVSKKMPPWFADPHYGPYLNDRSLSQRDIDTIVKWADSGAPEGTVTDAPPPVEWPQGWFIKPDIIVDGPVTDVPAKTKNNVVEWISVIMPSGLTKDTWVTSVQIKPEFPEVTHHLCIGYIPHNPAYKYGVAYWTDKERDADGSALPDKGPTFLGAGKTRSTDDDPTPVTTASGTRVPPPGGPAEDCYLPGNFAADYRPLNAARLIPAGSDIVRLALHAERQSRDRSRQGRVHRRREPAGAPLRVVPDDVADRSKAVCDSAEHAELGEPAGGSYVPAGCRAGVPDAAHACPRQGHDVLARIS